MLQVVVISETCGMHASPQYDLLNQEKLLYQEKNYFRFLFEKDRNIFRKN
jgi:hypothetical protein